VEIALAYNDDHSLAAGEADDSAAVEGVLEQVGAVEEACRQLGHEPRRVPAGRDLGPVVAALSQPRPDLVFSMVESVGGDARLEPAFAYLLEWLLLPYTGSPPLALALALHKPLARHVLAGAGVAVPSGVVLERADDPLEGFRYPVIVKPSREDGSHGIRSESVVQDEASARARAAYVIERYAQPALVEDFVPGRELNVSLLGPADAPVVLPLRELRYDLAPGLPEVVGYEAKWLPESPQFRGTTPVPAELEPALAESVAATACAAYAALGLRDYGRVDVRLGEGDGPLVIDVNPNPALTPGMTGLPGAAAAAGMSYTDVVGFVLDQALARSRFA
jgi:D-alanine-D-alanine ligase